MEDINSIHICIFTQSPLCKAPRVVKEANCYAKANFKVTVYGLWSNVNLLKSDRALLHSNIIYKAGVNLLDWNSYKSKKIRFNRLLARLLVKHLGVQTHHSLGYDYNEYLMRLLSEQADLYVGHEEMSMALAKDLLEKGKKVAFDFEDWHSTDLLPKDKAYRPIKLLERLEKYILDQASYCYTTSDAMAMVISDYYNSAKPNVIYNSFLASQREQIDGQYKDVLNHDTPSVYWFSQVISEGRGLELLFDALPLVKTPFQLHLRGSISENYRQDLMEKIPDHVTLYIHELVQPEELISRIAEHDLGIAFEESYPENRNFTISNKVFHYFQSGIPILATETAGQVEIAHKSPNAIKLVNRHPLEVATSLDYILNNRMLLKQMKEKSWQSGGFFFAFEKQEERLLHMINKHLHLIK